MKEILSELIAYRTVSGNRKEANKAFEYIKSYFDKVGWQEEIFESNGFENRYYSPNGSKTPTILFTAHIDVVAAPEDLFIMKIEGGRYYGRGVLDMKFAAAQFIELAQELGSSADIGILFTSDEEIGGFNGTRHILDTTDLKPKIVFLPDGGYDWLIEEKAKGVMWFEITAHGESSHASRPWEGDSAIETLVAYLYQMRRLFSDLDEKSKYYHTTVNIGKIEGGESANSVAAQAIAKLDIRYIPEDDPIEITNRLKALAKTFDGKVSVKETISGKHRVADLTHPHISKFIEIAGSHGMEVGKTFSHGSSDARYFFEKNIPVLMISPHGAGHHTDHEWISISSLETFCEVVKDWTKSIATKA
jgi:succinyl-diaminopimelate desuccinylase